MRSMPKKTKDKIPDHCEFCGVERGKKKFHKHHILYKEDGAGEITVHICQPCHQWCHGRRVLGHILLPKKVKHKSDKGLAMINFALKVLQVFLQRKQWVLIIDQEGLKFFTYKFLKVLEDKLIEAEEINQADRILQNFSDDEEETTH